MTREARPSAASRAISRSRLVSGTGPAAPTNSTAGAAPSQRAASSVARRAHRVAPRWSWARADGLRCGHRRLGGVQVEAEGGEALRHVAEHVGIAVGQAGGAVSKDSHQLALGCGGQRVQAVGDLAGAAEAGEVVKGRGLLDHGSARRRASAAASRSRRRPDSGSPSTTAAQARARLIAVSKSAAG